MTSSKSMITSRTPLQSLFESQHTAICTMQYCIDLHACTLPEMLRTVFNGSCILMNNRHQKEDLEPMLIKAGS